MTSALQVSNFAFAEDADNFSYANPTEYASTDGKIKIGTEGKTAIVATFAQLKFALSLGNNIDKIIIDPQAAEYMTDNLNDQDKKGIVQGTFTEDNPFYVAFDEGLQVSSAVTIESKVPTVFARSASFTKNQDMPALFNVSSTGDLTLDADITMTGEEVSVTFNEGTAHEETTTTTATLSADTGTLHLGANGTNTFDLRVFSEATNLQFWVADGGRLACEYNGKVHYVLGSGTAYKLATSTSDQDVKVRDTDGNDVSSLTPGQEYVLYDPRYGDNGYIKRHPDNATALYHGSLGEALVFKAGGESGYSLPDNWGTSDKKVKDLAEAYVPWIITDNDGKILMVDKDADWITSGQNLISGKIKPLKWVDFDDLELPEPTAAQIQAEKDHPSDPEYRLAFQVLKATYPEAVWDVKKMSTWSSNATFVANDVTTKNYGTLKNNAYYIINRDGYVIGIDTYRSPINNPHAIKTSETQLSQRNTGFRPVLNGTGTLADGRNDNFRFEFQDSSAAGFPRLWSNNGNFLTGTTDGGSPHFHSSSTNGQKPLNYANAYNFKYESGNSGERDDAASTYVAPSFTIEVDKRDGSENNGDPWTAEELIEGGYFIQVNNGKVTIKSGVKLTGLNTDSDVKNVAPVVVKGSGDAPSNASKAEDAAKNFVLEGGIIEKNKIGYMGDGLDSTKPVKEIAGAIKGKEETGLNTMTNTAGGVIFTNGATGKITSGDISANKADAGGIIVTERSHVIFSGGNISSNIGVHHAGAAQVEHGATLVMKDNAKMENNIAWYKGGAVWATEWGTSGYAAADWSQWPTSFPELKTGEGYAKASSYGGGNFVMDGGLIKNNTAFARAGAVEVESNGVQLNGGIIENNYSRSLGGAIYIEGDSPSYSYTLVLPKGYITNNTAVFKNTSDANDKKYRTDYEDKLNRRIGDSLTNGSWLVDSNVVSADGDFNGAMGNGGGIWLCPVGGTSVFTGNNIYIWDNDAQRNKGGEDFYLHRGNGSAMLQQLDGTWVNEVTNQSVGDNTGVVNGPLALTNNKTYSANYPQGTNGVVIRNNVARDGGAIACNGTFIIGEGRNVFRYNARLDMTKVWEEGTEPEGKKINLKLQYKYPLTADDDDESAWHDLKDTTTQKDEDNTEPKLFSVDMDGDPDGLGVDDIIGEIESENDRTWRAAAYIPLYTDHNTSGTNYKRVGLYTIKNPVKKNYGATQNPKFLAENSDSNDPLYNVDFTKLDELDMTNEAHVEHIYRYIADEKAHNRTPNIEVAKWNIRIVETFKTAGVTYAVETTNPKGGVGSAYYDHVKLTDPIDGTDIDGGEFNITYSTINFGQTVTNKLLSVEVDMTKTHNSSAITGDVAKFKYYEAVLSSDGANWVPTGNGTDVTTNSEDGKLKITGLNAGKTYMLFETAAPAGYVRQVDPWFIVISSNGTPTIKRLDDDHKLMYWDRASTADDKTVTVSADHNYTAAAFEQKEWPNDWLTDNGNKLNNEAYKLYKTNADKSRGLSGATFYMAGVRKENGGLVKGSEVRDPNNDSGVLQTVQSSGEDGTIDMHEILAYAKSKDYGGTAYTGKTTLFLYEQEPSGTRYKAATMPWLVILDKATGAVEIKQYKDSKGGIYSTDEAPWAESDFELISTDKTNNNDKKLANEEVPIVLTKVGEGTDANGLGGSRFKLFKVKKDRSVTGNDHDYIVDTSKTYPAVTSEATTGKITLPTTENGEYFLFEETTASGYELPSSPWLIKINEGIATVHTETGTQNENGTGNVITGKHWENILTDTIRPTNGIYTTEYFTTPSLKKWPYWFFSSTAVADNKLVNEKFNVELTKVDHNGSPVDGAKFDLYYAGLGQDASKNLLYYKIEKANEAVKGSIESKEGGKISLPITAAGYYFLFETEAPEGFLRAIEPWLIHVDETGKTTVLEYKNTDGNKWYKPGSVLEDIPTDYSTISSGINTSSQGWRGWLRSWYDGNTVAENKLKNTKPSIEFIKVDRDGAAITGQQVTFKLHSVQKAATDLLGNPVNESASLASDQHIEKLDEVSTERTVSASGKVTFNNVDTGKFYFVFEDSHPIGYLKSKNPWLVYVKKDGTYRVWSFTGTGSVDGREKHWDSSDFTEQTGTNKNNLTNENSYIELLKYKSGTEDNPETISNVRFQLVKLTTPVTTEITSVDSSFTLEKGELNRITDSTKLTNGQRVFLLDSLDQNRYIFSIPSGDDTPVRRSALKLVDYPKYEKTITPAMTFYLEEHEVNGEKLYAFRSQNGRYLSAESGDIETNGSFWSRVRSNSSFQSGLYTEWKYGIRTSLFKIGDLTGTSGGDIRAYWYDSEGNSKENKIVINQDSNGPFVAGEYSSSNRSLDIYSDKADRYLTESSNGIYKTEGLHNGYYQLFETTTPDGYQRMPIDDEHRMIIKLQDGEISIISGSDVHLSTTDNSLRLKLSNDELTSIEAEKTWGNGTAEEIPTDIEYVEFTLKAKKGDTTTDVETRRVSGSEEAANNWKTVFEDLPKYYYDENGKRENIDYSIVEKAVTGYTPSYIKSGNKITVNNRKITGVKVNLTIDKSWTEETPEKYIPDSIQVEIWTGIGDEPTDLRYTETLTKADNWTLTMRGLDRKDENGNVLNYWVKEVKGEVFKQVKTEPDYTEATEGLTGSDGVAEYTAYTRKNPSVDGDKPQAVAKYEYFVKRNDGTEEQVFCLNYNYQEPSELDAKGEGGVKYTRKPITKDQLADYVSPKTDNTEPYTPSTELYYKILKAIYLGSGGDGASLLSDKNVNNDDHLLAHMTQYAIYEYTDFNMNEYAGKTYYYGYEYKAYRNYTDKSAYDINDENEEQWSINKNGYAELKGPYGLIQQQKDSWEKNHRIKKGLETPYHTLMQQIENKTNAEIDNLGLNFYIYEPVEEIAPNGKHYQYLIGVDSAAVNMHAAITNEMDYGEITLYKHSSKETSTNKAPLGGVKFHLYEETDENDAEATTIEYEGKTVHVLDKGEITTASVLNQGEAKIQNLVYGRSYYLVEFKTQNDHILLSKPVKFKLSKTSGHETYNWNEDEKSEIVLKAGASVSKTELRVSNKAVYDLPKTGGMGTYWFMVIGAMMMGFALTAALTKLKIFRR